MKPGILIIAALTFALATPLSVFAGALGVPVYFNDPVAFHEFNLNDGKTLKGVETFEESNIPPGGKQILPAPFCPGQPNVDPQSGYGFPDGLAQDNICVVDNITPGPSPATLNPSAAGTQALYVIGPGFIGSNSDKVGEDLFLFGIQASVDLIFNPDDNHTGVGFWLSRFDGFPNAGWVITTYDKNDNILGVATVPGGAIEPAKQFFGVWVDPSIGRINIWDPEIAPDAIDDIEMWVPEPSSLALLTVGALALLRRRR